MSLRVCGSSPSGAASTASKSSIGSARRTPRRRIASMILWRAMALTHGASLRPAVPGLPLQVDRQQGFLHDILDIRVADPARAKRRRAPSPAPPGRSPRATADRPPRRPPGRRASAGAHLSSPGPAAGSSLIRPSPRRAIVTPPADHFVTHRAPGLASRPVTCGGRAAKTPANAFSGGAAMRKP